MKTRDRFSERVSINDIAQFSPSKTKQSMKDECDVNLILKKYHDTGIIEHTNTAKAQYGDFAQVEDYQTASQTVIDAERNFMALPSHIRKQFQNSPQHFMEFISDEKNSRAAIALGLATERLEEAKPKPSTQHSTTNLNNTTNKTKKTTTTIVEE